MVSVFVWFLQAAIKIAEAEWSKNTTLESKSSISEDQHNQLSGTSLVDGLLPRSSNCHPSASDLFLPGQQTGLAGVPLSNIFNSSILKTLTPNKLGPHVTYGANVWTTVSTSALLAHKICLHFW